MSELIERKAAIDAIEKNAYRHTYLDQIIDIIKALPSAQPETHEERTETHACDCISRQAVIEVHYEYCNKHPDASFPVWSLKILEDLPSAQPDLSVYSDKLWKRAYERGKAEVQAEIVRCKDCKYWMPHSQLGFDEDNGTYHDYCAKLVPEDEYYAFYRNADDFCSRAERRTDDTD